MTVARTRKVQTDNTSLMSEKTFADLKEAMEDALAFERGHRRDLKVTQVQSPRPRKARHQKTASRIDGAKPRS